ncbi:MAG: copper resistance protein NlpE [Methylococcaceae bacterium]
MQIFRQRFNPIAAFFLFIAFFSASTPVFSATTETNKDTQHTEKSLEWPGIYYGFIPCADCKGVKTTLALNKNNTYLLITQYVGRSEREFVEKGKFALGDKSNTIVLTPRNGSTTQQYLVGENSLVQLDNNGNRVSGELANRYILRRSEMEEKGAGTPPSHASH